jgi:hypothetical protein
MGFLITLGGKLMNYYNTGKKDFIKQWMKVGLIDLWPYALLDFLGIMLFLGPFINQEIYQILIETELLAVYILGALMFIISSSLTDVWFRKLFTQLEYMDYFTRDKTRKNIYKEVIDHGNDITHTNSDT